MSSDYTPWGIAANLFGYAGNWINESYNRKHQMQINRENIAAQKEINQKNIDFQKEVNEKNLGFAQSQFDYQKALNEQTMQREDNAIQRSVADYQAAGMNKMLAIGNPSQSSVMQTSGGSAGQEAMEQEAAMQKAYAMESQSANIGNIMMDSVLKGKESQLLDVEKNLKLKQIYKTEADTELARAQELFTKAQTVTEESKRKLLRAQAQQALKNAELAEAKYKETMHNLGIGEAWNRPTGIDPVGKNYKEYGLSVAHAGLSKITDIALEIAKEPQMGGHGANPWTDWKTKVEVGITPDKKYIIKYENKYYEFGSKKEIYNEFPKNQYNVIFKKVK